DDGEEKKISDDDGVNSMSVFGRSEEAKVVAVVGNTDEETYGSAYF
ncbi:hypothetical protein A2U01_0068069, partial [Trifolium medium]|nr:hypothetical protein [Trifolium medium]